MRTVLPLRISAVRPETADTVTVTFHDPGGRVGGEAGQYVIVRVAIEGEKHRRVYSLSSTPELGHPPSITVKRLPGGLVSTYLVERAEAGQTVGVETAAGEFRVGIAPRNRRTYYAFAAGSGIVPVMSILRAALAVEPDSHVHLVYGNRRPQDVIFAKELHDLATAHPDRLDVVYVMSEQGHRIDYRLVDAYLVTNPPRTADVWYLLCGPPGMNHAIEARLLTLGVSDDRLLVEHYVPPRRDDIPAPHDGARVRLDGHRAFAALEAGEVLLTAMDRLAAPVPYACRSGVCGTCRVRLVAGRVDPGVPFALTEAEQESGVILTCVARPVTPEVVLRPTV